MENAVKKGKLFIISGPSGAGKGTIRLLAMQDPTLNIFFSVSMTTRKIRPGEVDGSDYYFVSREEFMENVKNDNFIEWAEYVGNCYGTPKDKVEKMLNEGKNVLLEIDINGATKVIKQNPDVISIFIAPPSLECLVERLKGRGTEPDEVIAQRVNKAKEELKCESMYKYTVINDNLVTAVEKFKQIIKSQN